MTSLHNVLSGDDMHTLIRWTHADAAARQAEIVGAADIGKLSRQIDDGSLWIAESGTWKNISGLGYTFAHPLNLWPSTGTLNEWYGPDFWQSLNDGTFPLDRSFGVGADPALGNYQILGTRVPFDCVLERIDLYGYINSLSNNLEIRWYKFTSGDNVTGLSGQVQVGVTTTITNENNMRDLGQDVGLAFAAGDFIVPFFRDSGFVNQNGQFMGQLLFREILT